MLLNVRNVGKYSSEYWKYIVWNIWLGPTSRGSGTPQHVCACVYIYIYIIAIHIWDLFLIGQVPAKCLALVVFENTTGEGRT